ncbi:MAG: S4 domain-containing protein [Verrucomicrobiales bacterium]|nr:S4 domain-containing protein [Verrucomicrobiales bacterium]
MASDEETPESTRLDLWLWSTRLYKTRTIASDACKNNRITVNGQKGKPARQVRVEDRICVDRGSMKQEVEVKAILSKRVGAKLVSDYLIDHTSPEEYARAASIRQTNRFSTPEREPGTGRPTKKERRELDQLMDDSAIEMEAFEKFAKALAKKR